MSQYLVASPIKLALNLLFLSLRFIQPHYCFLFLVKDNSISLADLYLAKTRDRRACEDSGLSSSGSKYSRRQNALALQHLEHRIRMQQASLSIPSETTLSTVHGIPLSALPRQYDWVVAFRSVLKRSLGSSSPAAATFYWFNWIFITNIFPNILNWKVLDNYCNSVNNKKY